MTLSEPLISSLKLLFFYITTCNLQVNLLMFRKQLTNTKKKLQIIFNKIECFYFLILFVDALTVLNYSAIEFAIELKRILKLEDFLFQLEIFK